MERSTQYKVMADTLNSVYKAKDYNGQINQILELIGNLMEVSRARVYEHSMGNAASFNTFEWCAPGIAPHKDIFAMVSSDVISDLDKWMNEQGIVKIDDVKKLESSEASDILNKQGVGALLAIPIYTRNTNTGFISLQECKGARIWHEDEIEMLMALSGVLETLVSRHNLEEENDASRRAFRKVLNSIDQPISVSDATTKKILFANDKFKDLMGSDIAEGKDCKEYLSCGSGGCEKCPVEKLREMPPGAVYNWEVYNSNLGKWFYCTDCLIEWLNGGMALLRSAVDITARKEHEEQLRFEASYDSITGMLNRRSGMAQLGNAVAEAAEDGITSTFCFIDVDGLKAVNDTLGHPEGDRLLSAIGATIKKIVRGSDLVARIGGDEFMILFNSCAEENAAKIVKKIKEDLNKQSNTEKYPYELSISVGLEEITPQNYRSAQEIVVIADQKMYEEKKLKKRRP